MANLKITNPEVKGKLKLPAESASKVLQVNASGELESSAVTTAELANVAGLTSAAVSVDGTQTLTNKTLTAPVINSPTGIVKADVGLANVDNTSDANKPVSVAQALADTAVSDFAIQRTNHTGTQLAATISDFTAAAKSAAVSDSITDAVTDVAPSQNAVFDALALKIDLSQKGANNGVASLDAGGKVPVSQLPSSIMTYEGTFNAALNIPHLSNSGIFAAVIIQDLKIKADAAGLSGNAITIEYTAGATAGSEVVSVIANAISVQIEDGVSTATQIKAAIDAVPAATALIDVSISGTGSTAQVIVAATNLAGGKVIDAGMVYVTNVAGSVDFGAGAKSFALGDYAIYDGAIWDKSTNSNDVVSVAGKTGVVTLVKADVGLSNVDDIQQLPLSYLDIDDTLAADSDSKVPSQQAVKAYVANQIGASAHAGDIAHSSFAAANNQAVAASVTGLAFAVATVRSFRAQVSVSIDATTDLNEIFDIQGIQLAGGFVIATSSVGDDSGVVFTITSAGQIEYTSQNSAGFLSNTIKFRASVTDV